MSYSFSQLEKKKKAERKQALYSFFSPLKKNNKKLGKGKEIKI